VPPINRTRAQQMACEAIVEQMPKFALPGYREDKGRFALWQFCKAVNGGKHIPYGWQLTGSCFLPRTLVRMADGTEKPIEQVAAGDEVVTHRGRARKVLAPTTRKYTGRMVSVYAGRDGAPDPDGRKGVTATACHDFYLPRTDAWMPAGKLRPGDVVTCDGRQFAIADGGVSDGWHADNLDVHCLQVEEDHSFIANGFSVHNCVGAGGGNMLRTLARVEIATGDPEEWHEIWWPYTYGQSRRLGGMNGQGEGSVGSAWAKAIVDCGIFSYEEGAASGRKLEEFHDVQGWLQLSRSTEMEWSDGGAKNIDPWKPLALKHPVKTASPIGSVEEAKAAIQNGYPLTIASNFGTRTIRPQGTPAVNVAEWDATWPHQMYLDEAWDHPSLGLIFRDGNNWGPDAHPAPTQGEPPGGFYYTAATLKKILSYWGTECFAFSAFTGFVVRELPWII
jgi:hypothetical protein